MSSAKRKKERTLDTFGKSFMSIKNNNGPSTDPCGTSQDMFK